MGCLIMGISDKYKTEYLNEWLKTSDGFPHLEHEYELFVQKAKEREMDAIVKQLLFELRKHPENIKNDYPGWGKRVKDLLRSAGDGILELSGGGMKKLLKGGYLKVTSDFIIKARKDDASVSTSEIMQAMRNAWIMNCIQVLFGREVEFTTSIYAYSMLYPYTDNYLDATDVSLDKKNEFGARFRSRLEGKLVKPQNPYECKVFRLVEMIESQYERNDFPQVYESLLEIHDAQHGSLEQQEGIFSPNETDIPGISIKKGGSSVLADGFLVNGLMTEVQASFIFGFGIFLQLIDDAQDVTADKKNNHFTIFSKPADKCKLDPIMNKLFNFMYNLLDNDKCFVQTEMLEQKALIKSACKLLLFVAVANNARMYSREYMKSLEKYSPFRFSYLKKLYRRAGREYIRIFLESTPKSYPPDSIIAEALIT